MGFLWMRQDESRQLLAEAFYFALGSYTEQEATKTDTWRDADIGQLYAHLKHELEEIEGNLRHQEGTYLVHNAIDVVSLSLIFLARVMQKAEITEK